MFLRKESFQPPHLEVLPKKPVQQTQLFDVLSLVIQAEQAVDKVTKRNPLLKVFKPVKEQPIDPIEGYIRRFFKSQRGEFTMSLAQTKKERADILTYDTKHLVWEGLEAKKETVFHIELNREDGCGEGYPESINWQLANFVKLIEQQGLLASRGFLEQILFQKVYNQLFSVAENHLEKFQNNETNVILPPVAIMVTSPPDKPEAGYHGSNSVNNWKTPEYHHSFHFVYLIDRIETYKGSQGKLKVKSVSVKVVQFRTWHNIQGLLDLHNQLGAPLKIDKQFPVTNQILANSISFEFPDTNREAVTGQLTLIEIEIQNLLQKFRQPPTNQEAILDYFRKELYRGENKWAKNTKQIPEFSSLAKQNFEIELGMLTKDEYQALQHKKTLLVGEKKLIETDFIDNPELKILQIYPTFESLQQNSFFHKMYLQPVLELLKNSTDSTIQNPKVKHELKSKIELIAKAFLQSVQLRVRELNINPEFTKVERRNLLFAALKDPFKLPFVIEQLQSLSSEEIGVSLNNPDRLKKIAYSQHLLEKSEILGLELSAEEKMWLSANFGSLFAVGNFAFGSMQCYTIGTLQLPMKMVDLSTTGNLSPMMIDALNHVDTETKKQLLQDLESANYIELDLPGANTVWMVPASYMAKPGCRVDENGMVCGPCITEDFPLGIPFDHPLEQANPLGPLPMNRIQFAEYLNQLKENILQNQLEDQLNFEQLSDEDKTKGQILIKRLTRKLFKVTLSNLIAGVDEHQEDAFSLPQEKLRKIKTIEALEQLVLELESSDDETDHNELEELAETLQAA